MKALLLIEKQTTTSNSYSYTLILLRKLLSSYSHNSHSNHTAYTEADLHCLYELHCQLRCSSGLTNAHIYYSGGLALGSFSLVHWSWQSTGKKETGFEPPCRRTSDISELIDQKSEQNKNSGFFLPRGLSYLTDIIQTFPLGWEAIGRRHRL